jgi:2OG-Fe(II) oxygenase superfamily
MLSTLVVSDEKHPLARHIELSNESGERLQIEWVHPKTGEHVPYGVSEPTLNHRFTLESFVNHTFIVRTILSNQNHNQTDQEANMKSTLLTVGEPVEQLIVVKKDLTVEFLDDIASYVPEASRISQSTSPSRMPNNLLTSPSESSMPSDDTAYIVHKCREMIDTRSDGGMEYSKDETMKQLVECFTSETAAALMIKNEYLSFQKELRRRISGQAENYTCSDPNLATSKPVEVRTWTNTGVTRDVGILHNRPASQIHIVHDFISETECKAIEKAAQPLLHRGTVADGKGGSRLSENRKAWQAGLKTKNWDDPTDPIAAVKRRLYAYANFVTGYNMSLDGQEDIMSIQYFGNGYNDTTPDRYTPHCDGDCTGNPHKTGGRVATMVMYCDVPLVGGATNFQNANVYIKPTKHSGVFFSYMNPKTHEQDEGFTTHSGCPVYEGTKRIAVQWMRVGVDHENPWDSFDTNTISLKSRADS